MKKAGWSLSLTLAGARRNGELVALADSTLLRFMQELQGVANRAERIYTLKTKAARAPTVPILSRRPTGKSSRPMTGSTSSNSNRITSAW